MGNNPVRIWLGILSTNGLILLFGVITGILAARLLLPEGRGVLALVLFYPHLAAGLGILSMNEGVTYRVSQPGANREKIVATAFALSIVLAVCTVAVTFLLVPSLLGPERADLVPFTRKYIILFIPANFVVLSLLGVDHGDMNFTRYNLLRILQSFLYLLGLVALWLFGFVTVENAAWMVFVSVLAVAVIRFVAARKELAVMPSWREAKALLSVCWQFHATAILFILCSQADRFVVMRLFEDAAIGYYIVALTVASSGLEIITSSIHTLVFPSIARHEFPEARRQYLEKALRYSMFLVVICMIPLVVISHWMVPFLFGEEYSGAVGPSMILLLAYVPMALRQITARSLRGLGDATPGTLAEGIALVMFLVAFWPLGIMLGLNGIGIALLISNCASFGYLSVYLRNRFRLKWKDWWGLNTGTFLEMLRQGRSILPGQYTVER